MPLNKKTRYSFCSINSKKEGDYPPSFLNSLSSIIYYKGSPYQKKKIVRLDKIQTHSNRLLVYILLEMNEY